MVSDVDPFPIENKPASLPPGLAAGMLIANKYELTRKLGTGAMGEVWAAKHRSLDEEVAIKLVRREVEHGDGTNAEERFLLEARVSAALARKTRHIVSVTDHGEDGPLAYLVMELLDGESLDARLARKGPMSLASVVPLVAQIARGLAVAHSEGIVHRDLKPSNIFVTKDEEGRALVKILDFGIAKFRASLRRMPINDDGEIDSERPSVLPGGAKHATMHGFLLGTPAFMSPEQAKGKTNIDHRADVWALGVIAYHLLTAHYPFEGDGFEQLLERLCRVRYTSILKHRPDLPDVVADFFARAFAMRIDQRFQSAAAFAASFEQLEPLARNAGPSLPPPPPPRDEPVDPGSMVAAGVPPKGRIVRILAGAALVVAVLAGTSALVSLNYERDPSPGAKLTAGANVATPPGATTLTNTGRDAIPLPEEVKASATPDVETKDLPAAAVPAHAMISSVTPASKTLTPIVSAPAEPMPQPVTASAPPAPPSQPRARHDKSEVF